MAKLRSWFSMRAAGSDSAEIGIFSDIGAYGVTAQDFYDRLRSFGTLASLVLRISSNGGDVSTGFAIYNMLNRNAARKLVTVEGLAASMASVVAMAGDEIAMPQNAMLMIHNPVGSIQGGGDQIASFAEAIKTMQANMVAAYRQRSGQTSAAIRKMMNAETWLSAAEAKALGFADRIEKPLKVSAALDISRFNNAPAMFGRMMEAKAMTKRTEANGGGDDFESDDTPRTEAEIRAAILADHAETRALVEIAGKPAALADDYIKANKSRAEVVAALAKLREADVATAKESAEKLAREKAANGKGKPKPKAGASDEISTHHNPADTATGGAAEIDTTAIYKTWNSAGKRRAA